MKPATGRPAAARQEALADAGRIQVEKRGCDNITPQRRLARRRFQHRIVAGVLEGDGDRPRRLQAIAGLLGVSGVDPYRNLNPGHGETATVDAGSNAPESVVRDCPR